MFDSAEGFVFRGTYMDFGCVSLLIRIRYVCEGINALDDRDMFCSRVSHVLRFYKFRCGITRLFGLD